MPIAKSRTGPARPKKPQKTYKKPDWATSTIINDIYKQLMSITGFQNSDIKVWVKEAGLNDVISDAMLYGWRCKADRVKKFRRMTAVELSIMMELFKRMKKGMPISTMGQELRDGTLLDYEAQKNALVASQAASELESA